MENVLKQIDVLFEQVIDKLCSHNETFFIENEEDYGYVSLAGDEVNECEFTVYSDSDKYGYYNQYAIQRIENGVAYLIGIGDTEGDKELLIKSDFNYIELYAIAELCNFDDEPKFMCNSCHDHFNRDEMDFDVDDDQDLCKNCNYQSYNDAPYGQD
jgi:hypothetical protein